MKLFGKYNVLVMMVVSAVGMAAMVAWLGMSPRVAVYHQVFPSSHFLSPRSSQSLVPRAVPTAPAATSGPAHPVRPAS